MVDIFDIPLLNTLLLEHNVIEIKLHRIDRKIVYINAHTHTNEQNDKVYIHACSKYRNFHYGRATLHPATRESDLRDFLNKVLLTINTLKECEYCEMPFPSKNNLTMCVDCAAYACVLTREPCIICTKSDYPTKFKCGTCIESTVCLKCANNPLWKNICPTCKEPPVIFGGKRRRYETDNESDNED